MMDYKETPDAWKRAIDKYSFMEESGEVSKEAFDNLKTTGRVIPLVPKTERVQFEFPETKMESAGRALENELILLRARIIKIFHIPQFLDFIIRLLTKKQRP